MKQMERDDDRSGRQHLTTESSDEEEVRVDHIKVGSYYEIDQSKLPPTSPVQLQMVKIVMVCGKNDRLISVRYPSIFTLKSYFRSGSNTGSLPRTGSGTTTKMQKGVKLSPALDEKYSMVNRVAAFALFRQIKPEEFDEFRGTMSFWAAGQSTSVSETKRIGTRPSASGGFVRMARRGSGDVGGSGLMVYKRMGRISKTGNCLSVLKSGEVAGWGRRLRIRYVSNSDGTAVDDGNDPKVITPPSEDKGIVVCDEPLLLKGVEQSDEDGKNEEEAREEEQEEKVEELEEMAEEKVEEEDLEEMVEEQEDKVEEVKEEGCEDDNTVESDEDVKPKIPLRRNRKRKCKVVSYNQQSRILKKPKRETTVRRKVALIRGPKRRGDKESINRWSAERYKAAEENMLKIMKEKGASFEKPMLRQKLRDEARKVIGDTGLLDHLLKHTAGKVAPGGGERFRRRHNADGAMEYWLESADLIEVRKMAGVSDPYWKPPPGWKPGDNPSHDPVCDVEIKQLKEEVDKLKRDISKLQLGKGQAETDIVATTPLSCVSDQNLFTDLDVLPLKEVHEELRMRKFRLEQQMIKVSQYLAEMEEEMDKLSKVEKASKAGSDGTEGCSSLVSEKNEAEGGNKVRKTSPAEEAAAAAKAEEKATKIERLRSGFKICKPQGSIIWPNMDAAGVVSPVPYSSGSSISSSSSQMLSPTKYLEYIPAAQTLPSESPTTTKSPFLPLTQPAQQRQPVKPLARRLSAAGAAIPISTPSSYLPIITDLNNAPPQAAVANKYQLNGIKEHYGDIAIAPAIYIHSQNFAMIPMDLASHSSSNVKYLSTSPRLAAETSRLIAYADEKHYKRRTSYTADTSPVAVPMTHSWVPVPIPNHLLRNSNQ